jgi:hypothetical protein
MLEDLFFMQALLAHADRLAELLGTTLPDFWDRLDGIRDLLASTSDNLQVRRLVDDIIAMGLASPASDLVRSLLQQSMDAAQHESRLTGFTRMHDPTSGRVREVRTVPAGRTGSPPAPAAMIATSLTELLDGLERERKLRTEGAAQPERKVSTGFASATGPGTVLSTAIPLRAGEQYYFWLEVGALVAGSIEEVPTELPQGLSPAARLVVALFGFENEIRIVPGADVGELEVRPDGTFAVARQPEVPSNLTNIAILERRLFFPIRVPGQDGTYRLRCNIYHNQILMQSRLISASVMRAPRPMPQSLRAELIDYTLARTLAASHAPHRLSLMLNDNGNGTHGFRFFGWDGSGRWVKDDVSFAELELQDLIQQARGGLRMAAWGHEQEWQPGQAYRYDSPNEHFPEDLIRLAIRGYRLYDAIINRLAGGARQADILTVLMREPGAIQLALRQSARLVPPAALLYDGRIDPDLDLKSYELCPAFLSAVQAPGPLETTTCFQGHCPNRDSKTIVCPSGFWGYRHILGLPLSVATAPDVPATILWDSGPQIAVSVSTDENLRLRLSHERVLRSLRPDLSWKYADTRADALKLLTSTRPHVVYFYCHGGIANNVPYLQVGPIHERGITRAALRTYEVQWDAPRPLVFINGCHTTALEPELALDFVTAFVENAYAAGVIGTEITVFEPLATNFAEEFLRRFFSGEAAGVAIRGARLALLKSYNPLGLAYIPFAIATLCLQGPQQIRG